MDVLPEGGSIIRIYYTCVLNFPPHIRTQGLELSGDAASEESGRGQLAESAEVILAGPELVLNDPMSSLTGRALSGLLTAQGAAASGVSVSYIRGNPIAYNLS